MNLVGLPKADKHLRRKNFHQNSRTKANQIFAAGAMPKSLQKSKHNISCSCFQRMVDFLALQSHKSQWLSEEPPLLNLQNLCPGGKAIFKATKTGKENPFRGISIANVKEVSNRETLLDRNLCVIFLWQKNMLNTDLQYNRWRKILLIPIADEGKGDKTSTRSFRIHCRRSFDL